MRIRVMLVCAVLPLAGCAALGRAIHRHPVIAGAVASVVIAGAVYAATGRDPAAPGVPRDPPFVEHIPPVR